MDQLVFVLDSVLLITAVAWCFQVCSGGTPVDKYFTADRNASVVGNSVVLECSSGAAASHLIIRRLDNGQELNSSQGLVSKLMYRFRSISCEDMGTYECELNRTDRMKTEIMVHNCRPKPCNGETVNKTVNALVNQTVNFSLCAVTVPDIFEFLKFNGTNVRKKNYDNWTWDYEEIQPPGSSIKQFNISVFASALQTTEFGILIIRVYSSNGLQYFLDFNILLRSPGAPDCPTDLKVTDQSAGSIMLSWKPGLDGGSPQRFHVYSSIDNSSWAPLNCTENCSSSEFRILSPAKHFYAKVVSSNIYKSKVDEHICDNGILVPDITQTSPREEKSTEGRADSKPGLDTDHLYIVLLVGVGLLFTFVLALCLAYKKKERYQDVGLRYGQELASSKV